LLDNVTVIGAKPEESRYLSIIVDGISGEEVLRALLMLGISTDSGSACSPEDLTPSHVIAAMGYPTTGHLRFTIHPETSQIEIDNLSQQISKVVQELRS
jgi:cysteine desulfurase